MTANTETMYWRENEGDAFWSQEENGNLYSFNGSFITQTGGVGEHILFIANW